MFVVGVLVVLLGVLLSIALHEVGHLLPAKAFKVKVTQYMVGFGPTLWSRRRGETEYGVKAVPLGGYVRMIGMFPPAAATSSARRRPGTTSMFSTLVDDAREASAAEVPPGEEDRAFYTLSVPKKLVVMLGGPVMNLLIAVVLLIVVFAGIGLPTLTSTLGAVAPCVTPADAEQGCAPGDPVAPGAAGGLVEGDQVVSWGGVPVADWDGLSAAIREGGTGPVEVGVVRDGVEQALVVTPAMVERPVIEDGAVVTDADGAPVLAPVPFVGIGPTVEVVRQPLGTALATVGDAVRQTAGVIFTLPARMIEVGEAAFGDAEREDGVIGLIGVGRVAGEMATIEADELSGTLRAINLLSIIASLNVALFVFNLVPLVPLDGGHVAGALWEGLRRQVARLRGRPDPGPVDVARAMPLAYAVILVLVAMSLVLAYADIVNPITF